MPKIKQKTKAFILVPQDSVDPSLALCGDEIIINSIINSCFTGPSLGKGHSEQKHPTTGPVN